MSTLPTNFEFNSNTIRVVTIDGEPWFVAADVCKTLGLYVDAQGKPNVSTAVRGLNPDEIGLYPIQTKGRGNSTRTQRVKVICEAGLYRFIMRSDKPEARKFQDWVTREVIPTIRKTGGYILGEEKVATGEMDEDELVLKAILTTSQGLRYRSNYLLLNDY